MQKSVLISVPVPVVSTVPPEVSWSFELYLYLELTVPQVLPSWATCLLYPLNLIGYHGNQKIEFAEKY